ncbi:unnamed protein product [Alopecurus aequalis]
MASFPFDPTPFLPPGRQALEIEGRPARVRVIHGDIRITNEDLAILTILPMPPGEVAFQNVREIVDEYLRLERRIEHNVIEGGDNIQVEEQNAGNQLILLPVHQQIEEQLAANAEGWDHWAMPPAHQMIDLELHAGEFLELNDLIGNAQEMEVEENVVEEDQMGSDLTLTFNPPVVHYSSDDSVHDNPIIPVHYDDEGGFRDIDLNAPPVPEQIHDDQVIATTLDIFPDMGPTQELDENNRIAGLPLNNSTTMMIDDMDYAHTLMVGTASDTLPTQEVSQVMMQLDNNVPEENVSLAAADTVVPSVSDMEITVDKVQKVNAEVQTTVAQNNIRESEADSASSGAPPGFPIALYKEVSYISPSNNDHIYQDEMEIPVATTMMESCLFSEASVIGDDGAALWRKHFAPSSDDDLVTKVPIEWMNFFTAALLSPEKFEWAKSFLASQLWKFIVDGTDNSAMRPFVIPNDCPVPQEHALDKPVDLDQVGVTPNNMCAVAGSATTSAMHANRKRKEKGPMVETEVDEGACSSEALHKQDKKKKKVQNSQLQLEDQGE